MSKVMRLFAEEIWECHIRCNYQAWSRIIASNRYWCADPFVVKDDEGVKWHFFCEMLDRYKSRGFIGYSEIKENGIVKPRIIEDLGCHASYPCVFRHEKKWYMIPETVDRHSIELYTAAEFPFKWNKIADLASHLPAVDTTVFQLEGEYYVFIYEQYEKGNRLSIGRLDFSTLSLQDVQLVQQYSSKLGRPAGNVIMREGRYYRPTQYGVNHYGEEIVFKEFCYNPRTKKYWEKDVTIKRAEDFLKSDIQYTGCHTYNCLGKYEVIDVLRRKIFLFRPVMCLLKKLKIGGFSFYVR